MRVAIVFYAAAGVALIAFGCVLQNPPKGYAPGMFVAVGALNLFAACAGFYGSYNKKRVLFVFIIFGGLSTLLQIVFEITLFTVFNKVLTAIRANSEPTGNKYTQLGKQLNIMRWVMVGFIFVELLTLVLAVLLKWVIKVDRTYHGFDEENNQARMLAMGNLRSDIDARGPEKQSKYDKIRENMAAKYGSAVGGSAGGWKQKAQVSWANGREPQ